MAPDSIFNTFLFLEFRRISVATQKKIEGVNLWNIFAMFGLKCFEIEIPHSGGLLTWSMK